MSEVCFHKKARLDRVKGGIGLHFGGIQVQFAPPDESGLLALLHHLLEKATKDLDPIARADLRQTGMIGQWLVQIVVE